MYEYLLSPVEIGSLRLRNRIAMAPMGVEIAGPDGMVDDNVAAYYEERARGGAGLIITGACAMAYPRGANSSHQLGISDDSFIPGLSRLAERVKSHGVAMAVQLVHHGKVSRLDMSMGREVLVPSIPQWHGSLDMVDDLTADELAMMEAVNGRGMARLRAATRADIGEIIDGFAAAAIRAREAGFDGVEIHGAHGCLISGFLSGQWNLRDDEYGGSVDCRSRLLCEVIRAVKERAGREFPVWCRLDALEYRTPDGISFEDAVVTSRLAVEAGADAIHLSAYGDVTSGPALSEGSIPFREAAHAALTGHLKTQVTVPVIAVGRISPEVGDEMIAHQKADVIAMGRQLLADPALGRKLVAGRGAEIRPCINCYECVAQPFFARPVKCAVNPMVARETELARAETKWVERPRTVVVVGGGPAGMEAARVAASRGHRVTLLESSGQLGGSLAFAAVIHEPNRRLLTWMIHQMGVTGVDVRLNSDAAGESVSEFEPDVVIVATGARPARPGIPGIDMDHVFDGDDLRRLLTGQRGPESPGGWSPFARVRVGAMRLFGFTQDPESVDRLSRRFMPIGKRVVVMGGGLIGIELAEFLAGRDRIVTVVEGGVTMATEMAHPRRWRALADLRAAGVELMNETEVVAITEGGIICRTSVGLVDVAAENVIVATGFEADATVADSLRDAGFDPVVVGDAGGLGYIGGAITQGFAAGLAVG